jgi:hypothetical protein
MNAAKKFSEPRLDPPTWSERIAFAVARVLVAGMLVVALLETDAEMPAAYDLLMRVAVCLVSVWGCWFMPRLRRWGWAAFFLVTLLLFNPFFVPALGRGIWHALDLVWAALFVLSLAFIRPVPPARPGAEPREPPAEAPPTP